MVYHCSVCDQKVDGDMLIYMDHTEKHVIDLIKHDHPEWVQQDGLCVKCAEYYRQEIKGSIFKDAPCALRLRKGRGFVSAVINLFQQKKGS